jgi:hypothetical protein
MARTGNGQAAVLGPNPLRIPVAAAAGNSYNRMAAAAAVAVVVVAIVVVVVVVVVVVAVTATATTTTCASPSGTPVGCVAYSDHNLPDAPLPSRAAGHRSKCAAKL